MAVAPLKIVVGIKVGGDSESFGAELFNTNHSFKGCYSLTKSKKVFN